MAIHIRRADLEADRQLLINALSRDLNSFAGLRFEWLYRQCPHGPAHVWIAEDGIRGPVVGVAAAFPRRMFVAGGIVSACVFGDFCIHSGYRSLGPALSLQRACLEEVDSETMSLAYDFPSAQMAAIYRRLQIPPQQEIIRLAKPLRVDRKLSERIPIGPIAKGLSKLGNRVLAWRDDVGGTADSCALSLEEGPCGEEFTALAWQLSACYGTCAERSADYLNWRYRVHPLRHYEILAARRKGALVGYAVFVQEGADAGIADLFGIADVLGDLVRCVASIARERGVITLSASVLASHPWRTLLEGLGFRVRESRPVVVYLAHQFAIQKRAVGHNWFLMDGDRES